MDGATERTGLLWCGNLTMPAWLGTFLRDWGPLAGVLMFVGGALAGLGRGAYSLFASGTIISRSRHRAEVDWYLDRMRLNQEAYDRRIEELRQDVEDMIADRDAWREWALRAISAGQSMVRGNTPPGGIRRPELGP